MPVMGLKGGLNSCFLSSALSVENLTGSTFEVIEQYEKL